MFMNSSVLALVIGAGILLFFSVYAAYFGGKIALKWNPSAATEEQLELEKRTYLVSTIVKYLLLFQILSLLLFVYTVDDIHEIIPGAMCATGSLKANVFGFPTLIAKLFTFFLYGSWIAINRLDTNVEEMPLIKVKYFFLLACMPFLLAENVLMVSYFANIDPETLVSCCGVVFTAGDKVVSIISPLPRKETMILFFAGFIALSFLGLIRYKRKSKPLSYTFSLSTIGFFFISIAAVISFIASYIYQMPSHPCPFDILQKEYNYIGYPMYVSLLGGTLSGMLVGVVEPFKNRSVGLLRVVEELQTKAILFSLLGFLIFLSISLWYMFIFLR